MAMITRASEATAVKAWAAGEARQKFTKEKDISFATDCLTFAHDYVKKLPIGFNIGDGKILEAKIAKGIKEEVVPKHYGFWTKAGIVFAAILFLPITIEVIICWAIWKVLDVCYEG